MRMARTTEVGAHLAARDAVGSISFTYDSNGNTATKTQGGATTTYTWDYENRLTEIDNPTGDDYVYEYDGDGMRVRAGHDSGQGTVWDTRFYYYTGAGLYSYLFESDNAKNMTVAYTTDLGGHLVSQRRGGASYYHLYDRLGSTRQLLETKQTVTDAYSYYAFGEMRSSSGSTTNALKFVGRLGYYDNAGTDLQYLRARYYAPGYGRFLSADPGESRPQYAYVDNVAPRLTDPSGAAYMAMCPGSPPPGLIPGGCWVTGHSTWPVSRRIVGSGSETCTAYAEITHWWEPGWQDPSPEEYGAGSPPFPQTPPAPPSSLPEAVAKLFLVTCHKTWRPWDALQDFYDWAVECTYTYCCLDGRSGQVGYTWKVREYGDPWWVWPHGDTRKTSALSYASSPTGERHSPHAQPPREGSCHPPG